MKKNDEFTLKIEDMGVDGEGIGRCEGMTFFVKDAVIGDTIRARAIKLKKTYGYARLMEILIPSEDRVLPRCAFARPCGGCQLQALSYEKQLAFKQRKVENNLRRIGGFSEIPMEDIVGMEEPYGYRNKAQFPIGTDADGRIITGFYAGHSHRIIPNRDCALGIPQNREILDGVIGYMEEFGVSAYSEETGTGLVRHVLTRCGFATGEIMVCLIVNARCPQQAGGTVQGKIPAQKKKKENMQIAEHCMMPDREGGWKDSNGALLQAHAAIDAGEGGLDDSKVNLLQAHSLADLSDGGWKDPSGALLQAQATADILAGEEGLHTEVCETLAPFLPHPEELIRRLLRIPGMTSICMNFNTGRDNVILGRESLTLWGRPFITDTIGGISFRISPLSFYQVNPVQTENIYRIAMNYADLHGEETVWDLYCGIGTISLFLAQKAKQVYGVEIIPSAVDDARENAARNGITNAEFFVGKAETVFPEKCRAGARADVVVVDPPRKGCDPALLETILTMQPERIIYVSCDSATLARDLKILCAQDYRLVRVQPVDNFPQSCHVETVILLSQRKADAFVEVDLDLSDLDLTSAEMKATYEEINAYIKEKYDLNVSNLYIAQIKEECGILERENYNLPKGEGGKKPHCPIVKREAILDAFEHFKMI